jgi:uncharacterized protein YqgV (UPF0045/DUF77 family)
MKKAEELNMLKKDDIAKIYAILNKMEGDDFNTVARMFNEARKMSEANTARSFTTGQKVKWVSSKAGAMAGTVTKVNRKTIKVKTAAGMWSVSPSLLKAA